MEIKVRYALNGTVNGAVVGVRGTRTVEQQTGTLELALDASPVPVPQHWDPTLVVVGCMDGLILASASIAAEAKGDRLAWLFGPDEIPVHLDTRVTVYDDSGREVGTAVMSSVLERVVECDGGVAQGVGAAMLDCRTRLIKARFRFLPTERVTSFGSPARAVIMPATDCSPWTTMTTATVFETNFGNTYRAVAVSSFEIGGEASANVESFRVQHNFERCAGTGHSDVSFQFATDG